MNTRERFAAWLDRKAAERLIVRLGWDGLDTEWPHDGPGAKNADCLTIDAWLWKVADNPNMVDALLEARADLAGSAICDPIPTRCALCGSTERTVRRQIRRTGEMILCPSLYHRGVAAWEQPMDDVDVKLSCDGNGSYWIVVNGRTLFGADPKVTPLCSGDLYHLGLMDYEGRWWFDSDAALAAIRASDQGVVDRYLEQSREALAGYADEPDPQVREESRLRRFAARLPLRVLR